YDPGNDQPAHVETDQKQPLRTRCHWRSVQRKNSAAAGPLNIQFKPQRLPAVRWSDSLDLLSKVTNVFSRSDSLSFACLPGFVFRSEWDALLSHHKQCLIGSGAAN